MEKSFQASANMSCANGSDAILSIGMMPICQLVCCQFANVLVHCWTNTIKRFIVGRNISKNWAQIFACILHYIRLPT